MMQQPDSHRRAIEVFQDVLANVTQEQMTNATPCAEWDVAALVDHVVNGNVWVQTLAGRQPAPVPPGNARAAFAISAAAAHDVFNSPDGLDRTYELPFGQTPGAVFALMRTNDLFTHAWDLATATGQSTDLDPQLAASVLAANKARISDAMRGEGKMFGLQQQCPEDRPMADQAAAFLGRVVG
jgi:uncharacterized protein (TIGR03086 family)